MNLRSFDIIPFQLPLSNGPDRKGCIIKLKHKDNSVTFGEVSPLPNWSFESLDAAITNLKTIKNELLKHGQISSLCYPSVLFGLDQATTNKKTDLDIQQENLVSSLEDLPANKKIKVKLKGKALDESILLIKKLLNLGYKPSIDLNRSWHIEKTLSFTSHFSPSDITYIEEPTTKFRDLERFYLLSGFNYALDETLLNHPLTRIVKLKGLSTLIIKPTLYGGRKEILEIIKQTPNLAIRLSSAYESNIGTEHLKTLAHSLNLPVGLDTYKFFLKQLCYPV